MILRFFIDFIRRATMHHDDVIKWKHFPHYWPFVRGIHRSPVNSLHKGQWRGALMFSLIGAWINGWVNNRETDDLRRRRAHYDAIVMLKPTDTLRNFAENPLCCHHYMPISSHMYMGDRHLECWLFKCILVWSLCPFTIFGGRCPLWHSQTPHISQKKFTYDGRNKAGF